MKKRAKKVVAVRAWAVYFPIFRTMSLYALPSRGDVANKLKRNGGGMFDERIVPVWIVPRKGYKIIPCNAKKDRL